MCVDVNWTPTVVGRFSTVQYLTAAKELTRGYASGDMCGT